VQYLEKYWKYFHRTFSVGAFWDKDERVRFWDQKEICTKTVCIEIGHGYAVENWEENSVK